jgi:hypothetical protein
VKYQSRGLREAAFPKKSSRISWTSAKKKCWCGEADSDLRQWVTTLLAAYLRRDQKADGILAQIERNVHITTSLSLLHVRRS